MTSKYLVEKNEFLLESLFEHFSSRSKKVVKAVLRDRQVSVDGRIVTRFDHPLFPGTKVEVSWEPNVQKKKIGQLEIVFEDEDLIIINKPAGLLSVGTDKEKRKTAYSMLSSYVRGENEKNRIFIIHRLDRDSSGLLMFAKSEKNQEKILKTWKSFIDQRTYIAVVEGEVDRQNGTIASWLTASKAFIVYSSQKQGSGQRAVTHFTKLQGNTDYTLVQIQMETGHKHQARVHMQDITHPIIGDKKYGAKSDPIHRLGLHAQVLVFTHPRSGKICRFGTVVPKLFLQLFSGEAGNTLKD